MLVCFFLHCIYPVGQQAVGLRTVSRQLSKIETCQIRDFTPKWEDRAKKTKSSVFASPQQDLSETSAERWYCFHCGIRATGYLDTFQRVRAAFVVFQLVPSASPCLVSYCRCEFKMLAVWQLGAVPAKVQVHGRSKWALVVLLRVAAESSSVFAIIAEDTLPISN